MSEPLSNTNAVIFLSLIPHEYISVINDWATLRPVCLPEKYLTNPAFDQIKSKSFLIILSQIKSFENDLSISLV